MASDTLLPEEADLPWCVPVGDDQDCQLVDEADLLENAQPDIAGMFPDDEPIPLDGTGADMQVDGGGCQDIDGSALLSDILSQAKDSNPAGQEGDSQNYSVRHHQQALAQYAIQLAQGVQVPQGVSAGQGMRFSPGMFSQGIPGVPALPPAQSAFPSPGLGMPVQQASQGVARLPGAAQSGSNGCGNAGLGSAMELAFMLAQNPACPMQIASDGQGGFRITPVVSANVEQNPAQFTPVQPTNMGLNVRPSVSMASRVPRGDRQSGGAIPRSNLKQKPAVRFANAQKNDRVLPRKDSSVRGQKRPSTEVESACAGDQRPMSQKMKKLRRVAQGKSRYVPPAKRLAQQEPPRGPVVDPCHDEEMVTALNARGIHRREPDSDCQPGLPNQPFKQEFPDPEPCENAPDSPPVAHQSRAIKKKKKKKKKGKGKNKAPAPNVHNGQDPVGNAHNSREPSSGEPPSTGSCRDTIDSKGRPGIPARQPLPGGRHANMMAQERPGAQQDFRLTGPGAGPVGNAHQGVIPTSSLGKHSNQPGADISNHAARIGNVNAGNHKNPAGNMRNKNNVPSQNDQENQDYLSGRPHFGGDTPAEEQARIMRTRSMHPERQRAFDNRQNGRGQNGKQGRAWRKQNKRGEAFITPGANRQNLPFGQNRNLVVPPQAIDVAAHAAARYANNAHDARVMGDRVIAKGRRGGRGKRW